MATLILSIGTNLGNRHKNLTDAIAQIAQHIGTCLAQSPFYQSTPWGFESDNLFLNGIVIIDTTLTANDVLTVTQNIEKNIGRKAKTSGHYADRIIDIDLIDYAGIVLTTDTLTLPHPRMHQRNFVLKPLCDVAPNWLHPVLKQTAKELLTNSPDTSELVAEADAR
ncbi:MAG: 2-amino-4-hydroxy-6-hydroxymethyldihydropteridine diphosphokinase [Bacteroidales bacterium]|nr:2-amino-4-hydroxy-6-hydroxymethyldihydropteridine diphosphokinase [Bacteroidales bacterium]